MWTKGQLVDKAFGELALAGYEYDLTPDERQDAASSMEAMLAVWRSAGAQLPYAFAADPSGIDLDDDSGLPLGAVRTVYCGLAIDLLPRYGKQLHPSTRSAYATGYALLLTAAAFPPPIQQPSTLPVGAGNKYQRIARNPFFPSPDTGPLQIAEDGGLNLGS